MAARNEEQTSFAGAKAGEMGLQAAGGRALTVAEYEARIHLYKEQAIGGFIGIGRTLNEAKQAGVVGHGEWVAWVESVTGLSIRQAQRCMRAAQEIREGSFLGQLDISKATMLLSSGLEDEEQEYLGARAAEEGATVKELKEQIRTLKIAKVSDAGALAEAKVELKKAQGERDQIRAQMQALHRGFEERMDEIRRVAYEQGKGDGARDGARADAEAEGRIREMERRMADAEIQAKDREKKLGEQLREADIRVKDAERKLAGQLREAEARATEAERKAKEAEMAAMAKADREFKKARHAIEEEARADIRKEYEGKMDFLHSQHGIMEQVIKDLREQVDEREKEGSARWDEGFRAGQERIRELESELEAAESREAKRAKELADLRKEKAQAGMDAARGIRAERMQGMDLAAAVRSFIGAVGTLPQMGPALAGMDAGERDAIRAQVDTVAEWVRASRTALDAIRADARIE